MKQVTGTILRVGISTSKNEHAVHGSSRQDGLLLLHKVTKLQNFQKYCILMKQVGSEGPEGRGIQLGGQGGIHKGRVQAWLERSEAEAGERGRALWAEEAAPSRRHPGQSASL